MSKVIDLIRFASVQSEQACKGVASASGNAGCDTNALGVNFQQVANTLIFLVGAIAVIMVIIGALRYVTSNGDSAGIKGAKDTITYALVGIVIALLAFALVSWVIGRVS